MKLDRFALAYGSPSAIKAYIEGYIAPYKMHPEDMSEIISKIIEVQENLISPFKYSFTIWDTSWPHRVWMFNDYYSAFNRSEDEPASGNYVQQAFQITAQRQNGDVQASVIYHVLKNHVTK